MNAKLPCLIACRRDDPALARSADRDRLAAQIRVIALFGSAAWTTFDAACC